MKSPIGLAYALYFRGQYQWWILRAAPARRTDIEVFDSEPKTAKSERAQRSPRTLISALQLRAARALLGIDQRQLAEMSGVSLPTIQRMEASEGNVRGMIDTHTKVIEALDRAGLEILGDNAESRGGGRGVRLKQARASSPP